MSNAAATPTICPNCGTESPPSSHFCVGCGTSLDPKNPNIAHKASQKGATQQVVVKGTTETVDWEHGVIQTIKQLGERIDGWADLLDGLGSKSIPLTAHFENRVAERLMPAVRLTRKPLTPGGVIGEQRHFHLIQTRTGATVAVYIGKWGNDLYLAWNLYVRPVINWLMILLILLIAAVYGFSGATRPTGFYGNDEFSLILFVPRFLMALIALTILLALAGIVLKRSPRAYFIKQLTEFDADDITAMMLSVHHSLLQAADSVGIDTQLLRVKEQFRAGGRDRII